MSNPLSRALLPGGILRIGLNSPKVNAINLSLLEELARAFQFASVSSDVRSVLLASDNPKVFSAGLDLSQLSGYIKAGDRSALAHFGFTAMDAAFLGPSKCPKPVAAAVDGHAIAGGLILGLACDYFVMNPRNTNMRLGLTELQVGVPFPPTPLAIIRSSIPSASAARLVYTAGLLTAQECVDASVGVPTPEGVTPEDYASEWLRLTTEGRPAQGFASTKQSVQRPSRGHFASGDSMAAPLPAALVAFGITLSPHSLSELSKAHAGLSIEGWQKVLLDQDLRRLQAVSTLPPPADKGTLRGPIFLQIMSLVNVCAPLRDQPSASSSPLWLVTATNGPSSCQCLFLRDVAGIGRDTPPGTKFILQGTISVSFGKLLVLPDCVTVLGGTVPSLLSAWQQTADIQARSETAVCQAPPFTPFTGPAKVVSRVKEMKSESGAAVDGGAGAAAASTATVSAKPRKAKPAAPSKRAGTTDLDAALQRARGRIVPITANVVSLELVDPFRPDLDPEPSVMLGLSDGKQSTVAVLAKPVALYLLVGTPDGPPLSVVMRDVTGKASVKARLAALSTKLVGCPVSVEVTSPEGATFPIVVNLGP